MFDKEELLNMKEARKEWEEDPLKRWKERMPNRKDFKTLSGIPINDIYTPEETDNIRYIEDIGFPGSYPFTRGAYPTMYRSQQWSMRQLTGLGGAEETNARFKEQLTQGTTRLGSVGDCMVYGAYDDPDTPEFDRIYGIENLGRTGYIATTLKDYEVLYDGIPLDKVSVASMLGHFALRETGMIFALAKKRGTPLESLRGITQNDSLQLFAGNYYPAFPPECELKLSMYLVKYCAENVPNWYCMSMAGYNRQECGCNAYQEIGITISDAITYIKEALSMGIDMKTFLPRLSFHLGVTMDFFEEAAKMRAARRVWAKVIREKFGFEEPELGILRFYGETSGSALTAQQPYNNIIRVTTQALSAVLGGANAVHTAAFDEALCAPTEFSANLASRTQQIIYHETGTADVVDPLAGSYYVEYLTNEIERRSWEIINKVEEMGGSLAAIRDGFYFKEMQQTALTYQNEIERKERIIVGVNEYTGGETQKCEIYKGSKEAIERSLARLRQVREEREPDRVANTLENLKDTVRNKGYQGSMEATIACCEAYCTFAEMNNAVREVCGIYRLTGNAILT
ncbi:methylmalonyl-CoA mutase family protein [Chloroflexota bacterium]